MVLAFVAGSLFLVEAAPFEAVPLKTTTFVVELALVGASLRVGAAIQIPIAAAFLFQRPLLQLQLFLKFLLVQRSGLSWRSSIHQHFLLPMLHFFQCY